MAPVLNALFMHGILHGGVLRAYFYGPHFRTPKKCRHLWMPQIRRRFPAYYTDPTQDASNLPWNFCDGIKIVKPSLRANGRMKSSICAASTVEFLANEMVADCLASQAPEAVAERLMGLGVEIGRKMAERMTRDKGRFASDLETVRFICKGGLDERFFLPFLFFFLSSRLGSLAESRFEAPYRALASRVSGGWLISPWQSFGPS